MKTTITGATGFVGKNLQNYLKTFHEVNSMSIRYIPNQQIKIETDVLIHLSGKAHDLKKVSNPTDYFEANFELTKQVFDAFIKSEASVFIFMSSVKAVADEVKRVLTEDAIPNPQTHYGISKLLAEQYILSKELPQSKRLYILRPTMIHGPGNKGNLNLLYSLINKGFPWPLGSFENQRSFCTIENLCFVIKELLSQEEIPSGVYNIADDTSLSTNELIQLIAASQNKQARILYISKGLITRMTKLGDYLYLPLTTERLQKLTKSYVVSNQKIVSSIRKSLPITSKNGLLKTFQSFKK
ncbi:NAD-dependent epimerase/dehydratase family protein [Flavobacteriaceae bacterium]|nr:NAD-dependent epimerase/dehydratase family protein [Flavobacteriaceae bacterium]